MSNLYDCNPGRKAKTPQDRREKIFEDIIVKISFNLVKEMHLASVPQGE
jgi:propanediol utilization protein